MKFLIMIFLVINFINLIRSQTNLWQQTSGPPAGNIVAIQKNSSGDIFLGAREEGIFKSTDNGESWIKKTSGIYNPDIRSLAISNNGDMFADSYGFFYRSTDNGENWFQTTPNVISAPFLRTNSQNHIIVADYYDKIYRSTDIGQTWDLINNGINSQSIYDLGINSNDHLFVLTNNGIFRSTDNGNNWDPINSGLSSAHPKTLAIKTNDFLFIGSSTTNNATGGVYRSTDNGDSWQLPGNELLGKTIYEIGCSVEGAVLAASYEGTEIYKSMDNGNTWSLINFNKHTVNLFYSKDSNEMFLGTYGYGVFLSVDNGINWDAIGIPVTNTYALQILNNGKIFAGCFSNLSFGIAGGVYYSSNYGLRWVNITNNLPTSKVMSISVDSQENILVGTQHDGIFRTTNFGMSWDYIGLNWLEDINRIVWFPNGYILAAIPTSGIARSTDNGNSWDLWSKTGVNCIEYDSFTGSIYAGISSGIYKSLDDGESWIKIGLDDKNITAICIDINKIFASAVYGIKEIFYSSDYGGNWELINSGSIDGYVKSIIKGPDENLYLGSIYDLVGVYKSTDDGVTWSPYNSGLNHFGVYNISMNQEGHLFLATANCSPYGCGGVYKSQISIIPSVSTTNLKINSIELVQNYPNPFNPSTTIKYHIPELSFVTLKVYDVLGNKIETLINEEKPAGTYEMTWYAEGLPSGVYFYQLLTNEFVETMKMILMK